MSLPAYRTGCVDNGNLGLFYCLYADQGHLPISVNYFYPYDWAGGGDGLSRDRQVAFKDMRGFGASGGRPSKDDFMDQRNEDAMAMVAHRGWALVVPHVWAHRHYQGCPPLGPGEAAGECG